MITVGHGVRIVVCEQCRVVRFTDESGEADAWDSMAAIFGDYELLGRVDAVRAPAAEVLAYRSQGPAGRKALAVAAPYRWLRVNRHLWMCHDGTLLLLAHGSAAASRAVGA